MSKSPLEMIILISASFSLALYTLLNTYITVRLLSTRMVRLLFFLNFELTVRMTLLVSHPESDFQCLTELGSEMPKCPLKFIFSQNYNRLNNT